jgi:ubiquinone/menaquinone biosynthesis C-methylase UbiE
MNSSHSRSYIPALKYHLLTRYYDRVVSLTTREKLFKSLLVEQIALTSEQRLLDVGCGTGTLTQMLAQSEPTVSITGLDADLNALKQAKAKLTTMSKRVTFEQGFAQEMSFKNASFDVAVSSLFFHHLDRQQKLEVLKEIRRVLKPEGQLHIADWGKPTSMLQRLLFLIVQCLDGFNTTQDSVDGVLPSIIEEAGFTDIENRNSLPTSLGTIRLYQAKAGRI